MAREGEAIIRPLADRLALMQPEPRVELQIPQLQKPFGHNILTHTHTLGSVIKEAQAGEREERSFPQKTRKENGQKYSPATTSNDAEEAQPNFEWLGGWLDGWMVEWLVGLLACSDP